MRSIPLIKDGHYHDAGKIVVEPTPTASIANRSIADDIANTVGRSLRDRPGSTQLFEEGRVMLIKRATASSKWAAYLMQLADVSSNGSVCARMHNHLGDRILSLFTGEKTRVVVAGLSRPEVRNHTLADPPTLKTFDDETLIKVEDGPEVVRPRHCLVVPPDSQVRLLIPQGVSHSFATFGENGAMVSVHPDEWSELNITGSDPSMEGQTTFLEVIPRSTDNCPAT